LINRVALTSIFLVLVPILSARGQEAVNSTPATPVFVDVFVTDKNTKAPVEGLTADDFQITESRRPAAITSFAQARDGSARPLSIWFMLLCPENGMSQTPNWNGSDFMRGHAAQLAPVLRQLTSRDTVGVAHWCDNSNVGVDLAPTLDRDAPVAAIETIMAKPPTPIDSYYGEASRLLAVRLVRQTAQKFNPDATVVLVFLSGDEVLQNPELAKDMLVPTPELPTIFFVVNNGAVLAPFVTPGFEFRRSSPTTDKLTASLQQPLQPMHFLATKTGGDSYSSARGDYGELVGHVATQLEGRYQLVFLPKTVDGKEHDVDVKLTVSGLQKARSANVRSRQLYIAAASAPAADSAEAQRDAALAAAMRSSAPLTEIVFDVSGKNSGSAAMQFRLFIDPKTLSWIPAENGDVYADLVLAISGISSQGALLSNQMKGFKALRSKADASKSPQSAVILTTTFPVPVEAVTVRFVLREDKSGHMGTFDVPVSQIKPAPASNAPAANHPAQP
jgi:hypothetical protein